jgi:hypothetical protein
MAENTKGGAMEATLRQMPHTTTFKELASRTGDGVEVSLLWSPPDDRLLVVVEDAKAEERFALEARADNALDVFYHPFAYAA